MIAARAMGLDVGAMSGFSNEIVDQEFFSGNGWKSNFLCNIGYADETALFQKLPRFAFDDVCEIRLRKSHGDPAKDHDHDQDVRQGHQPCAQRDLGARSDWRD